MNNIDRILKSVDHDRAEMDGEVAQYRAFGKRMESVLADHFSVEDFACAVERLTHRINDMLEIVQWRAEPGLYDDIHEAIFTDDAVEAVDLLARHLGIEAPYNSFDRGWLSSTAIYGYPRMRSAGCLVIEKPAGEPHNPLSRSWFIVDLATRTIHSALPKETPAESAARVTAILAAEVLSAENSPEPRNP